MDAVLPELAAFGPLDACLPDVAATGPLDAVLPTVAAFGESGATGGVDASGVALWPRFASVFRRMASCTDRFTDATSHFARWGLVRSCRGECRCLPTPALEKHINVPGGQAGPVISLVVQPGGLVPLPQRHCGARWHLCRN